jgi:clan AA aspartic protease
MVTGTVNAVLAANILFPIEDTAGTRHDLEATVDTGFTGYLTLPKTQILSLGLRYLYSHAVTLGDGTTVLTNIHQATVGWDGTSKTVEVIESEVFPLVGMRMMVGYQLRVDVVIGGTVEIEQRP